jgi:hypothetical protein
MQECDMRRVPCQTEVNDKSHNVRVPKQVIYILEACDQDCAVSTVVHIYRVLLYCCLARFAVLLCIAFHGIVVTHIPHATWKSGICGFIMQAC